MKIKATLNLLAAALLAAVNVGATVAVSQRCTLVGGSQLVDDCPVCDRIPIPYALRGGFSLRLLESTPIASLYAIEDFSAVGVWGESTVKLSGRGTYEVGGEVALVQRVSLEVWVEDGTTKKLCFFTNAPATPERLWPMLLITADQTNGTSAQQFHLDLAAAPFGDLWFSARLPFHAGSRDASTNSVGPGDLLSASGQTVSRISKLLARFALAPPWLDPGLDAVDILPGGEIAFSIGETVFSGAAGQLKGGDLLSDRGRVLTNTLDLLAAFGVGGQAFEPGLDAIQYGSEGEVFFSVTNDFFAEKLGRQVGRGDLLSSRGQVVKRNSELLAGFHPADPKTDYGLDAVHVWASGEIWFSTESSFQGQHFETYRHGDLLSDRGYVVWANSELLRAFQPIEKLDDFGLDALFLATDLGPAGAGSAQARCVGLTVDLATGDVSFAWEKAGRVCQLEKATSLLGPWTPASPVLTVPPISDPGAGSNAPQSFYRLRQW